MKSNSLKETNRLLSSLREVVKNSPQARWSPGTARALRMGCTCPKPSTKWGYLLHSMNELCPLHSNWPSEIGEIREKLLGELAVFKPTFQDNLTGDTISGEITEVSVGLTGIGIRIKTQDRSEEWIILDSKVKRNES